MINTLLNAVLLDGIELDVDRLKKINQFMTKIPTELHDQVNFRKVDFVWIHPSIDIGQLAYDHAHKLPRFIRYLLRGLGPSEDSKEVISYLLFDPIFCQKLMEAGYEDAMKKKEDESKTFRRRGKSLELMKSRNSINHLALTLQFTYQSSLNKIQRLLNLFTYP